MKRGVWEHHQSSVGRLTDAALVAEQDRRRFALGILEMLVQTRTRGLDAFKSRLGAPSSDRAGEHELANVGASVDHHVSDPDGGVGLDLAVSEEGFHVVIQSHFACCTIPSTLSCKPSIRQIVSPKTFELFFSPHRSALRLLRFPLSFSTSEFRSEIKYYSLASEYYTTYNQVLLSL